MWNVSQHDSNIERVSARFDKEVRYMGFLSFGLPFCYDEIIPTEPLSYGLL